MEKQIAIDKVIVDLKENKGTFYFYVPNTKGNISGAVAYIYDMVAALRENGTNAYIIHDKEYMIPFWMGGNYHNLPHTVFEKVQVKASDFLFLPEVWTQSFFSDMRQNNIKLPWEICIISQVYDLIFYNLDSGTRWKNFGVNNVITTSAKQAEYINSFMRNMNIHVVEPYIHEDFKPSEKPTTPKIFLYTRDKSRGDKLEKQFHLEYPQYAWIPFVKTSNMDRSEFASSLRDCCLAVWVDEISSFGTFPLECMKSGVPVVGKIPDMMPEWMGIEEHGQYNIKDNGIWLLNNLSISEYIAKYLDEWFTDTLNPDVFSNMTESAAKYNEQTFKEKTTEVFKSLVETRIAVLEEIKESLNQKN